MKVTVVIPARMGSSRYPGKPLAQIVQLPMIEHTRRRALLCDDVDEVIVATCDQEIIDVVSAAGGKAVMTKDTHERCTDRVEEAMQGHKTDIVIILQGDEPLIMPSVLSTLIEPLKNDASILCSNVVSTISDEADLDDVDIVKALLDEQGYIMYLSRAAVPFRRVHGPWKAYRQTGLSAFRKDFLHQFSALTPTPLEITESVDFMRMREHRIDIKAVIFDQKTVGVDRPEDVGKVESILKNDKDQKEIYERMLI